MKVRIQGSFVRNWTLILASLMLCGAAVADLQNVTVGGEIHIRGRYWSNVYSNAIQGPAVLRISPASLFGRAIGPFGTASRYDFDSRGSNLSFVEMRTRLHVDADFTNEVRAYIEMESYDLWGEDFRSDYVTGVDGRAGTLNDVEIYQSYIEAEEVFALPVRLRVGRQEMKLGKGWLVDDITTAIIGRSFDAVRLTYHPENWVVDAWFSKLAERSPLEEDGDIDFYGVYGTYTGFDALDVSAYWMLIRDARSVSDTSLGLLGESLEYLFGWDDYGVTTMHTVGAHLFGETGAWDYDIELAYQFGDADRVGSLFSVHGIYGDNRADYDAWAGDVEVGRRFDLWGSPRIFLGGAYYEGEDKRDVGIWEWLNPFDRPEASISFNRLFPGKPYSAILEIGQDMSNFWQARGGVVLKPAEPVKVTARLAYYGIVEPFDWPRHVTLGRFNVPIAPFLPFWTEEASDDAGWTTALAIDYAYSEDLSFQLMWEHLFPGDGLREGSFVHRYGLEFSGGTDDDSVDYIHVATRLLF